MKKLTFPVLCLLLATVAPTAPLFAAPPASDEIWIYGESKLVRGSLAPGGPVQPAIPAPAGLAQLAALPSGEVLATSRTAGPPYRVALGELRPDGSLRQIGIADPPPISFGNDYPIELVADPSGRLFLVVLGQVNFPHGHGYRFLAELDPATAATRGTPPIADGLGLLVTAPDGLWTVNGNGRLVEVDPHTLATFPTGQQLQVANGFLLDVAADSAGRLWYVLEPPLCGGTCRKQLFFYDPATGERGAAPATLTAEIAGIQAIAIRRSCADSPTARCLQGGRFRAEVDYSAYDGAAGPAQAARGGRSADTAVFSFFQSDNWELMVKVLDGCAINSHFWVYAAASTDVEYLLTITDLETGAQQVYANPLGRVAETITHNQAFSCGTP